MTQYDSPYTDVTLTDQSITERVFSGLENRPSDIVLSDGVTGSSVTAAEFMDQVKRLAGGLCADGISKGSVVALMAPNMPEYCVVFHAVAWAGGTITTLNPTYTAAEVHHQLVDSGAMMLVTIPAFLETAQGGIKDTAVDDIVVIGEADGARSLDDLMGDPLDKQVPVDAAADIVVLPYSSGTTGLLIEISS